MSREETPLVVDESALAAGLRAGDGDAFEAVVRRFAPRLLAVTRRLLRNEEDARDALRETFLGAFRGIAGLEADARLGLWLHRLAVSASLVALRSRSRSPERPIERFLPRFQDDGHEVTPNEPWSAGAARAAERREARVLVLRCIAELPESYRTVLVLRDIEGEETEAVASLLGIEPNAVKVRLHRARQALRALLDPHFRQESRTAS